MSCLCFNCSVPDPKKSYNVFRRINSKWPTDLTTLLQCTAPGVRFCNWCYHTINNTDAKLRHPGANADCQCRGKWPLVSVRKA